MFRLLFICALLISCTSKENKKVSYFEGTVLKSSKEFKIPKALKDKIKENYIKYVRNADPSNIQTDEEISDKIPRGFLEVDLLMRELNPGTLDSNTIFRFPRGGGLIDLAEKVVGNKGSFFLKFSVRNSENPEEAVDNIQAYFIGESKSKNIDGTIYGSGCGSTVDITNVLFGSKSHEEIRVNAKDGRYYHALAGSYIFVSYALEKVYLAALRITDSSMSKFECLGKN